MPVEDFNLAELFQTSLVSFDSECWEFSFRRTIPIGVYVDAGENSSDPGSEILSLVNEVLKESGFQESEQLGRYYGSFLSLNLSRSPAPLDGPTFGEKLSGIKNQLIERLRQFPWDEAAKAAGATVKVAVAIGTAVIIISAVPAAPLVIGSFVVPAKIWMVITTMGEGVTLTEEAKNIFLHSKAALKALREAEQATWSTAPTAKSEEMSGESMQISEKRLREIQEEVRGLREKLRNLKKQ